jgi:hypothetical protein
MNNGIIIANPIYDVVFKRLMDDTENARYFIETLLDQEVESIEFKPQEYPVSADIVPESPQLQLPGAMTFYRLDFLATIKTTTGDYQKVLIEVQKGKKTLDILRFREYLAEHYKRTDEVNVSPLETQKIPLHIITIYILGFKLKHIPTPAVKIAREYIDLITKKRIDAKEDFVEQLTHDSIIIQTPRIYGSVKTELDTLLSFFEQKYFLDDKGHLKSYLQPLETEKARHMAATLSYVAASEEDRRLLETEESIRRVVDGDFNKGMQKVRYKLKKQVNENKQLATENEQLTTEKEQLTTEKEQLMTEKEQLAKENKQLAKEKEQLATKTDQVLAEKEKQIAELLVRLNYVGQEIRN